MAISRGLHRLLCVLEIEEEQCRVVLESALSRLRRLEHAMDAARERERAGRRLLVSRAPTPEDALICRIAGMEETHTGARIAAALAPRIREAESEAAELREEFLAKRVERRQAETLIEKAEVSEAIEAGRRNQKALDDWYLNRSRRAANREAAILQSGPLREALVPGKRKLELEIRAGWNEFPESEPKSHS